MDGLVFDTAFFCTLLVLEGLDFGLLTLERGASESDSGGATVFFFGPGSVLAFFLGGIEEVDSLRFLGSTEVDLTG